MRSTISRKTLTVLYVLGLIWAVAAAGGAIVLMQPMTTLYETIGIESAAVQTTATLVLAILLATSITAGVALVLRATAGHEAASERA